MRFIGFIIAASLVMAVLKFAIIALCIGSILLLLWGALTRPKETAAFVLYLVILTLIQHHPWACLAIFLIGAALTFAP